MENQIQKHEEQKPMDVSIFSNVESFENAQRMAKMLVKSNIVPIAYQGEANIPNVIVALDMASRTRTSPIIVMQNLDVIYGQPSWRSTFVKAVIDSCGRFKNIELVYSGKEGTPERGCRLVAISTATGNKIEGPLVTFKMATDEGWVKKPGSKWQTMPELMLGYRSSAFFGRLHCSDLLLGMQSSDEVSDVHTEDATHTVEDMKAEFTKPEPKEKPKPKPKPKVEPEPKVEFDEAEIIDDDFDEDID
jgi:hypothetical protein